MVSLLPEKKAGYGTGIVTVWSDVGIQDHSPLNVGKRNIGKSFTHDSTSDQAVFSSIARIVSVDKQWQVSYTNRGIKYQNTPFFEPLYESLSDSDVNKGG